MTNPANLEALLGGLSVDLDRLQGNAAEAAVRRIRAEAAASSDAFDQHVAISAEIGRAESAELRRLLAELRRQFEALVLSTEMTEIYQAASRSPEDGWKTWLNAFGTALSMFQPHHAMRLCEQPFSFASPQRNAVERYRLAVGRIQQSRWEEAYDEIDELRREDQLPTAIRARLTAIAGQIELWRFEKGPAGRALFDEAETMAPVDSLILTSLGDYWLAERDYEKARSYHERAIAVAPRLAGGYAGIGDRFLKEERLAEAEEWYRKAVSGAAGDGSAYDRLLRLLGRPESLKCREAEFEAVVQTKIAVDPESEYETCLDVGQCYLRAKRFPEAQRWYEKAVELEKQWPRAYTSLAELSRALSNDRDAEDLCRKAMQVASDYPGAYILLASIYEVQGRWSEALALYGAFPSRPRQWTGFARVSAAKMYAKLGEHEAAERILLEELEKDVTDRSAQRALEEVAAKHYEERGDKEAATRVYAGLRRILGEQYEDDYHNRLANMHYYLDEYEAAIEEYRKAIEVDPREEVYRRNLSGAYTQLARAWERRKEPGRRMQALAEAVKCHERAQEVTPEQDHSGDVDRLQRRMRIVEAYDESVLDRLNVVVPIAVEVAADLIRHVEASPETLSKELLSHVNNVRDRLLKTFGVKIPGLRFRGNETDLPDGTYIVMIDEIPLVSGTVQAEQRFCVASQDELSRLGITGPPASDPMSGRDGVWVDAGNWEKVESAGLQLWPPTQYLMRHVETVLRRNLVEFLGHQELVGLLDNEPPDTLPESAPHRPRVSALTSVCRALLAEEVPIQPFSPLLTTFKDLEGKGTSRRETVERIRSLPQFRRSLPGNDGRRAILTLSQPFEALMRHSLYEKDGRLVLAMEPQRCQEALTAVRAQASAGGRAVVVEDPVVRPFVRKLVELEFPDLPVLSRGELVAELARSASGCIEIAENADTAPLEFANLRRGQASVTEADDGESAQPPAGVEIAVFTSSDFASKPSSAEEQPVTEILALMQDGLFYELGLVLPPVKLKTDKTLKSGALRFRLNGVEGPAFEGLGPDEFLVNDTADRLRLLNISGIKAVNPANGSECARVRDTNGETRICRQAGLTTWGTQGYLVLKLSSEIRRAASRFQTDEMTRFCLDSLAEAFPDLVRVALDRFGLAQISQLLRELLREEVSIRDLRSILESLLSIDGTTDVDLNRFIVFLANTEGLCPVTGIRSVRELRAADLADYVRASLKQYISHKYTRGGNTLVVYLLDPAIERRINETAVRPLTKEEGDRLREAIRTETTDGPRWSTAPPVILTSFETRRALKRLIESDFPELAVLSYQELSPDLNIQPIARISW